LILLTKNIFAKVHRIERERESSDNVHVCEKVFEQKHINLKKQHRLMKDTVRERDLETTI